MWFELYNHMRLTKERSRKKGQVEDRRRGNTEGKKSIRVECEFKQKEEEQRNNI